LLDTELVAGPPLLEIAGVHKAFGLVRVLTDVSLHVRRGEVVTIIGPSGSGKTTLLRCVNFLETYDAGSIRVDGAEVGFRDAATRSPRPERELSAMRTRTAMVFQAFNLFPHLTAAENIMLGLRKARRLPPAQARQRALHWLDRVGLPDKADRYPSELSGGQQQRVGIARAVAMEPLILLLDEVTSALDPELVGEVLQIIRTLAQEGMTMLAVTHEMGFAREVSDRIVFMAEGRVVCSGSAAAMLDFPQHDRLRAFLSRWSQNAYRGPVDLQPLKLDHNRRASP
jgi:polar amino acid transport system ATP-binding protein